MDGGWTESFMYVRNGRRERTYIKDSLRAWLVQEVPTVSSDFGGQQIERPTFEFVSSHRAPEREGFPPEREGFPPEREGFPPEREGFPSEREGFPSRWEASPEMSQAVGQS